MLLVREILDGNEVTPAHQGSDSGAARTPKETPGGDVQQVIRPEGGRRVPGLKRAPSRRDPAFPVYLFDIDGTLLDTAAGYLRR